MISNISRFGLYVFCLITIFAVYLLNAKEIIKCFNKCFSIFKNEVYSFLHKYNVIVATNCLFRYNYSIVFTIGKGNFRVEGTWKYFICFVLFFLKKRLSLYVDYRWACYASIRCRRNRQIYHNQCQTIILVKAFLYRYFELKSFLDG